MQDNDLPQIGTPMQTDETRAREVSMMLRPDAGHSELVAAIERAGWEAVAAIADDRGDANVAAQARHRAAFATPPAVEREGDRWRFARYLNGVRMAEGVAVTLADDLDTAISKAVKLCPKAPSGCQILVLTHAKGSPTLHPSDREEGVIAGLDGVWAWIDHLPQGDTAQEHLNAIDAARSAILALSGSLAPANGQVMPECICPKCGLRHGGGGPIDGGF